MEMQIKMFQASGSKAVAELEARINAWAASLHATQNMQLQLSAAITEGSIAGWTTPYVVVVISYSNASAPTAEANETTGK